MAACRGVVQITSGLGVMGGGYVSRIQPAGTSSSNLGFVIAQRAWGLNTMCNRENCLKSPRKMESLSTRAVANVATNYGAASEEEMLRRADSYFATDSRPIVLFDGVCNFCNAGVNFVLDNDPEGRIRMAALQSEAGRALLLRAGRSSDDLSSLVLIEKDRSYIKSEGVLRTAQYLGSLLPPIGSLGLLFPLFDTWLALLSSSSIMGKVSTIPWFFRDFVYDNVANNRYSILGKRDQCRLSDPQFENRFVV